MTPEQLSALMGYTSAVAMYLVGDGGYERLKLAADLLERSFDKRLTAPDLLPTPAPTEKLPDLL
jgi:hypothetical protein